METTGIAYTRLYNGCNAAKHGFPNVVPETDLLVEL